MLNDNHTTETDCHFDFEYEYNPHTHLSEFEECFRCVCYLLSYSRVARDLVSATLEPQYRVLV